MLWLLRRPTPSRPTSFYSRQARADAGHQRGHGRRLRPVQPHAGAPHWASTCQERPRIVVQNMVGGGGNPRRQLPLQCRTAGTASVFGLIDRGHADGRRCSMGEKIAGRALRTTVRMSWIGSGHAREPAMGVVATRSVVQEPSRMPSRTRSSFGSTGPETDPAMFVRLSQRAPRATPTEGRSMATKASPRNSRRSRKASSTGLFMSGWVGAGFAPMLRDPQSVAASCGLLVQMSPSPRSPARRDAPPSSSLSAHTRRSSDRAALCSIA